jgi:hypothetical protein
MNWPRLLEFQEVLRTVREHPPYQTCCIGNGMFSDNPTELAGFLIGDLSRPPQVASQSSVSVQCLS